MAESEEIQRKLDRLRVAKALSAIVQGLSALNVATHSVQTILAVAAKLTAFAAALLLSGCHGFWADSNNNVAPENIVEACENSNQETDDCMEARGYHYEYEAVTIPPY